MNKALDGIALVACLRAKVLQDAIPELLVFGISERIGVLDGKQHLTGDPLFIQETLESKGCAPGRGNELTFERAVRGSGSDVFQCHNSADKELVRKIGRKLEGFGVRPWLDDEQLAPGLPWQDELEEQLSRIGAAAVYVGPSNIGPWQRVEIRELLVQFVERGCPVIPVLLPGAKVPPRLPAGLRAMRWVDFRKNPRKALLELVWGITGKRPAELV